MYKRQRELVARKHAELVSGLERERVARELAGATAARLDEMKGEHARVLELVRQERRALDEQERAIAARVEQLERGVADDDERFEADQSARAERARAALGGGAAGGGAGDGAAGGLAGEIAARRAEQIALATEHGRAAARARDGRAALDAERDALERERERVRAARLSLIHI